MAGTDNFVERHTDRHGHMILTRLERYPGQMKGCCLSGRPGNLGAIKAETMTSCPGGVAHAPDEKSP